MCMCLSLAVSEVADFGRLDGEPRWCLRFRLSEYPISSRLQPLRMGMNAPFMVSCPGLLHNIYTQYERVGSR